MTKGNVRALIGRRPMSAVGHEREKKLKGCDAAGHEIEAIEQNINWLNSGES